VGRATDFFPDFESALAACSPGYNDDDLARVIQYKATIPVDLENFAPEQATNSIMAVGIAATGVTDRPLNILDFGGGCGFHYFQVVAATRMNLRWVIVETPTMAKRAGELAQGRYEVFTDIPAAAAALGRIDLVHASGSIQYVPDPLATLQELANLRAKYLAIARFPVWARSRIVALQSTNLLGQGLGPPPPGLPDRAIRYPTTLENFHDVMKRLAEYETALIMKSPAGDYAVGDQNAPGITLILRLAVKSGSYVPRQINV
jgi:putative methyltransferase (TIGR04325 family)